MASRDVVSPQLFPYASFGRPDPPVFPDESGDEEPAVEAGGPAAEKRRVKELVEPGAQIDRYVVLYRLGDGGMGQVFAAYDQQLDRKVAIKVTKPRRTSASTDRAHERLMTEAQTLARLSNPHVVAIHDVGRFQPAEGNEAVFVAMDFVEGKTLRRWLRAEPRRVGAILDVFIQAGTGLAAAHAAGIVHRDFKPDNVLVGRSGGVGRAQKKAGRVQVLDFGLAEVRATSSTSRGASDEGDRSRREPKTVGRIGTVGYMAPEQYLGEPTSPATDQFAFFVCLYEALYRRPPFVGGTDEELALSVIEGRPRPPPRDTKIPARLGRLIVKGLCADPQQRHPSMAAVLTELRRRPDRQLRRMASTTGLVLAAAGLTWVATRSSAPSEVCRDDDALLDGVWDEPIRARVTEAFAASPRPHAARSLDRVTQILDRYATGWLTERREACEATHALHEQSETTLDLRMACLRSRRGALAASAAILSNADETVIDNAIDAVSALPSLEACRDVMALQRRAPVPSDPDVQAQLDELESRLAQVRALHNAGRLSEAQQLATSIRETASELGYPAMLADALDAEARVHITLGNDEEAVSLLRQAVLEAERAQDDRLLAPIRIALVTATGDRLAKVEQGLLWAELARVPIEALGGDPALEARLENNIAWVLEHGERPEKVLVHRVRAVELAESVGQEAASELTLYHQSLSMSLAEVGRYAEALEHADEARSLALEHYGEGHPTVSAAESAIAVVHDYKGDYAEALVHYERARGIIVQALGPDNPRVADVLGNLAIAALQLGDDARAERTFREVVEVRKKELGAGRTNSAALANAYYNLGSFLSRTREYETALDYQRKALGMREHVYGIEHPKVAASLDGVANALENLDRREEALTYRRRAFRLYELAYGPEHHELAIPAANLAHNLLLLDRRDEALEVAQRALKIGTGDEVPADARAFGRLVLAKVLTVRKETPDRVRALVEEGRRELEGQSAPAERRLIAFIVDAQGWDNAVAGDREPP